MLSCFSRVQLFGTRWTVARQALLSLGFSRHEYWSGLPCPPPGDLPHPGIKPALCILHWQAGTLPLAPPGKPNPCTRDANKGDRKDAGLIPGSRRFPGGGHGNPLQYSCLENPTDRRTWRATVHRVTKSWTRLKQLSTHTA